MDYKDAVPQSQPLNERQVANNAGGFGFQARLVSCCFIGMPRRMYKDRCTAVLHVQVPDADRL